MSSLLAFIGAAIIFILTGYAETWASPQDDLVMRETTSAGALDVVLEPIPMPIQTDNVTNFKVTFYQSSNDQV